MGDFAAQLLKEAEQNLGKTSSKKAALNESREIKPHLYIDQNVWNAFKESLKRLNRIENQESYTTHQVVAEMLKDFTTKARRILDET
tara:strand:- start:181 stop:441 length:261 start_codon:yes stop_codon:yes gene_type:complete